MFSNASFRTVVVAVAVLSLLAGGVVAARQVTTDKDLVRTATNRGLAFGTLDEEFTQLRYIRTTDYGATWSDVQVAGDITSLQTGEEESIPAMDAITNNSNELVYAAVFPDAPTNPGAYAIAGPDFTPVLAIPEGANDFAVGDWGGWVSIGKFPNGDLIMIAWGLNASGQNAIWAAKSTNGGDSWGTPAIVAQAPAIPADASLYPHLSQLNDPNWAFVLFQDAEYDQFVLRIPANLGTGSVTNLNATAGSQVSYYTPNTEPIAYDPDPSALYVTWRNADLSGAAVYYSSNMGVSFDAQVVTGAQRYPSVALNTEANIPYVFSNYGVPASGSFHRTWYAYDEGGYGGGLWTDPQVLATAPEPYDGTRPLLYQNRGYFWDAQRGVAAVDLWGAATPEGGYASRTTDGGTSWIDFQQTWHFDADQLVTSTVWNNGLTGGTNGIAYIWLSGATGVSDLAGPTFTNVTLVTPTTQPGPWTVTVQVNDAGNDTSDIWLSYYRVEGEEDTVEFTSFQVTDPNTNSGIATFQIPATDPAGQPWATGDSIYFYVWSRDLSGNYGQTHIMVLVVGGDFLDVDDPRPEQVTSFALLGNYPNPFNPSTNIVFDLPGAAEVTVRVFNTTGQQVAVLADRQAFTQGRHRITFDGANLSTGVYFYTLKAGPYSASQKMLLVK